MAEELPHDPPNGPAGGPAGPDVGQHEVSCACPLAPAYHVLLVEDDRTTLKYVEQLLRKCSYQGVRTSG
jgi:hypothetical protein